MKSIDTVTANKTTYSILFIISFGHLINDMLQAVVPAVYPVIKDAYGLTFTQVGLITLTYQMTASILQPFVGYYTDKKPMPFSLIIGMTSTLAGLVAVSFASSFYQILAAVSLIGIGSSIFHPESSRVAHLAGGGSKGLAQSIFQVGGNAGSAIGPLLAALIVAPRGQHYIIWFALFALIGMFALSFIAKWYRNHIDERLARGAKSAGEVKSPLPSSRIVWAMVVLLILIFSKYFYMACMTSYYTFYLIDKFHVTVAQSQIYLFAFLASVAAGTIIGGPVGDRIGRKQVIWLSILGAAPFTLLLPHASLGLTVVLSILIGLIISSAFSAILVYATELVPGKVGLIAGLFFGLAFGMGGLGSAVLGKLADSTSLEYVFNVCAFLPLIGIMTILLPSTKKS
ncbi:MFS transporter [Chryseolinea sp. T2]|uniref:MFS transporter n=1 Tax=Chryseolinea sp. T2 TaxID=3129255 RepID=UPI0030782CE2